MLVLFEITDRGAIEILLAGVPESLGLLVFGIILVALAVLIRWVLGPSKTDSGGERVTKKV